METKNFEVKMGDRIAQLILEKIDSTASGGRSVKLWRILYVEQEVLVALG